MSRLAKDYKDLAASHGFVLVRVKRHAVFKNQNGIIVVCPATPSDSRRGLKQFKKDINRALGRHNNNTAAG